MNKPSDILLDDGSAVSRKYGGTNPNKWSPKYFFAAMGILFPIIVFVGFFPSFQSMKAGTLEVHWLTHIHSVIMTSWILLYLTQTILAATGNLKIHRRLGLLSFLLAVCVFIVMLLVSFHILIANHPPENSFLFDLLLIDFFEILCFALFFTWGMLLRKKNPGADKRLLTLATIVLLLAAVDRIQRNNSFPSLGMEYPAYSFIYMDALLIPVFLYDLITLKRAHKLTLLGTAIVVFFQIAVSNVYGSSSWHKFWFTLTLPLMQKVTEIKLSDVQSVPLLGNYESAIGDIIISRNKDKLYLQFGGGDKQELGAISETELFLKEQTMHFIFDIGPDGTVLSAQAKQVGRIFKMTKKKQP